MRRVGVRVQKAHGHGRHAFGDETPDRLARVVDVERHEHVAAMVDALGHFPAPAPAHQRRRLLPGDVIEPIRAHAADLEHITKSTCGDESRPGALALEDGVGGDRGAVHDLVHVARRHARFADDLLQPHADRPAVVVGARKDLAREHGAVRRQEDDVGERAADVDAYADACHR